MERAVKMGINYHPVIKAAWVLCAVAVLGFLLSCRRVDNLIPIDPPGGAWYNLFDEMLSWSRDTKKIAYGSGSNADAGSKDGIILFFSKGIEYSNRSGKEGNKTGKLKNEGVCNF